MTGIAKIETKPNLSRAILALAPGAQFIFDKKVTKSYCEGPIFIKI